MMETDWRADMTIDNVAKQSQTTTQGLMRDCGAADNVMGQSEHGVQFHASNRLMRGQGQRCEQYLNNYAR
jgi:hypothetical protein